jgi:hypothetical protein
MQKARNFGRLEGQEGGVLSLFRHADWSIFGPMNTLQLEFLMLIFAGWVNRGQQDVIEYLQEENRVLREQLGGTRLLFTERQRRRLAARAQGNWQWRALRDQHTRDAGHLASVVSEADREEVRWQQEPHGRSPQDSR